MRLSSCTISDTFIKLESVLTEINLADSIGSNVPELVISAAVLVASLQKWSKAHFTDDEVLYIIDSGKYLSDYTMRMNSKDY
tara:strand:+ start:1518 stop:1763 length:246 start_codon:yes stop_codon:yes gene_type:complete